MSNRSSQQASPQVTDDELIGAVQQQCEKIGTPVVPTKIVTDADQVTVTSQTVKRRLEDIDAVNSIRVGRGRAWWVPEEEAEARGEVDMSSIYLEELDPEDIPRELIYRHPDGPPTDWKKLESTGRSGMVISWMTMSAGLVSVGVADYFGMQDLGTLALLISIAGVTIFIFSTILAISGRALDYVDAPQPTTVVWRKLERPRNWIAEKISTK